MSIRWENNLDLQAIKDRVIANTPAALAAGMQIVKAVVTPNVPVETGNLVGSGEVTVSDAVGDGAVATAQLYYPGPYARYQEFGVFYRHGRFGAPLRHTHGTSFFLTNGMINGAEPALAEVARRLFA